MRVTRTRNALRIIMPLAAVCLMLPTLLAAEETAAESAPPPVSDCDTLRAIHQRLGEDESATEAREQLGRAILLLPDCVHTEGRLLRARTLDGVEVFRAGALEGLEGGVEASR